MKNENIKYLKCLDLLNIIFTRNGYTLYIVGGFIRDALMDKVSQDIDICSTASPEAVVAMLKNKNDFTIAQSNLPLGTMIIRHESSSFEYTAFRRESYRKDGTHTPTKVHLGTTIKQDALRRDFTCNALYYEIGKDEIIDFFDGINDIKNKVLRTTREPKDVFVEDALRILRMARISAETLLFPTEGSINAAIHLKSSLLKLSVERITQEIGKLFLSDIRYPNSTSNNFVQGIKILFDCGATDILFPGVQYKDSIIAAKAKSLAVKIALFIKGCTNLKQSLDYLCPNATIKKDVMFLSSNENFHDNDTVSLLAKYGYDKGLLLEEYLSILKIEHSNLSKHLIGMHQNNYIISMKTLALSGNDIKEIMKIESSPYIGELKSILLKHVIKHPQNNNREELIGFLKTLANK